MVLQLLVPVLPEVELVPLLLVLHFAHFPGLVVAYVQWLVVQCFHFGFGHGRIIR